MPDLITALGPPAIAAFAAIAGAWLQAKYGKRARLRVGDVEAEARTAQEVERLFECAENHKQQHIHPE